MIITINENMFPNRDAILDASVYALYLILNGFIYY
jgi:hypothetical protein